MNESQFIVTRDGQRFREETMMAIIRVTDRYRFDFNTDENRRKIEFELRENLHTLVKDRINDGTLLVNPRFEGDPFDIGRWVSWPDEMDPTAVVISFVPQGEEVNHGGDRIEIPRGDRVRSCPRRLEEG